MAYELVLSSSINEISFNLSNTSYGGIEIKTVKDSFTDEFALRGDNEFDLTRLYEDSSGEFEFTIEGPTVSGILYFYSQINALCDRAKKYTDKGYRFPLYLRSGANFRAYLKECTLELGPNINQLNTLKKVTGNKIKYVRRGIVGNPISSSPDTTNTVAGFRNNDVPLDPTISDLTHISSPLDIDIKFFNIRNTMPSGILFITNDKDLLVTMSGNVFQSNNGSVFSPSSVTLFNEDSNGAYSVYSAFSTGVLGFTQDVSTSTKPVITSGNINIEGILATNSFTSNKVDFYATMKTTSSGFKCLMQVLGNQDDIVTLQTDPIEIAYMQNPTVVYLGSFYSQSTLPDTRLFLKFTPIAGSGILMLDRFVAHGVPDENGRAIQIAGFQRENTTTSGNNYLRIISNYFPNLSTAGGIYPSLYARREEGGTDRWVEAPAYKGNIMLFNKQSDTDERIPVSTSLTNELRIMYLMTGHAIPASGIKWVHQDAHNRKTRIVSTALLMTNTQNIFIPPD